MRTASLAIPALPSTLPLAQVHLNEHNPRLLKDDRFKQLVKSLEEFPEMLTLRPLVINEAGVVLGGNMRLRAKEHLFTLSDKAKKKRMEAQLIARAEQLGIAADAPELAGYQNLLKLLYFSDEVPVTHAQGLSEAQQREFILKDNATFGEWDMMELANGEWGDAAQLNSWGLEVPKEWNHEVELAPEVLGEISLPNGEAPEFTQITFTLTQEQAQDVRTALSIAQKQEGYDLETGNENKNGNALAYLAQQFNSQHNTEDADDASDDTF